MISHRINFNFQSFEVVAYVAKQFILLDVVPHVLGCYVVRILINIICLSILKDQVS